MAFSGSVLESYLSEPILVNVSLIEFMTKIRRWSEMSNLGLTFNEKINQLERNFSVVTVIFKKFVPIFDDVFGGETSGGKGTPLKLRKGKKLIQQRVNKRQIRLFFDFCWIFYFRQIYSCYLIIA